MTNVENMTWKELAEFTELYKKRIKDHDNGTYFCENDNFDPETMTNRYNLLLEESKKRNGE